MPFEPFFTTSKLLQYLHLISLFLSLFSKNNHYITHDYITTDLVSRNQLNGNIPNFDKLPNLQRLELLSNGLIGSIPNFDKLPNLTALSISDNKLTGVVPNFSYLSKLTELNFGGNKLSGNIPNFSNLPKLQGLLLYSNQLTGNIPDFNNLPNLSSLWLYNNRLSGTIPNFRSKLTNLNIASNQLSGIIPNFTYFDLSSLQWAYFINNCGLTAFDSAQETILNQKDPQWKTQNIDCSKSAICPLVSISPNLDIHLPHLNYNNMTLSANLRYAPRDNKVLFEVVNYSFNSESCASANLSPDFKLHIPTATFGDMKLWADLQLYSIENDKITFELVKYGNS